MAPLFDCVASRSAVPDALLGWEDAGAAAAMPSPAGLGLGAGDLDALGMDWPALEVDVGGPGVTGADIRQALAAAAGTQPGDLEAGDGALVPAGGAIASDPAAGGEAGVVGVAGGAGAAGGAAGSAPPPPCANASLAGAGSYANLWPHLASLRALACDYTCCSPLALERP